MTPGVKFHDLLTVQLLAGLIDHVINDTGAVTPGPVAAPSFVVEFPGGGTAPPSTTPTTPTPPTTPTVSPTSTAPTTPTTPTAPTTSTPTTPTLPTGAGPSNLRSTTTSDSATLAWDGDPNGSYDILRGEGGVRIATVHGNTFTDAGLNANTPYVYSVRGSGVTTPQITVIPGSSPAPSTSVGTTPTLPTPTTGAPTTPSPTTGPTAGGPANLHQTGQTANSLTISWAGSATAEYDILRGEAGARIATVTGNSFTDIGLLANTPYVYSVRGTGGTTPQITLTIH